MSLIVFSMINLVGDPVDMLVNPESLPDEIERVRRDFGLDQPAYVQYWKFLTGALSGDLGNSFIFGRPALSLIVERFPATLERQDSRNPRCMPRGGWPGKKPQNYNC
jgi:peptide/nickel transport system permease protein